MMHNIEIEPCIPYIQFEICNIHYKMPYMLKIIVCSRNDVEYSPFTLVYQQNAHI